MLQNIKIRLQFKPSDQKFNLKPNHVKQKSQSLQNRLHNRNQNFPSQCQVPMLNQNDLEKKQLFMHNKKGNETAQTQRVKLVDGKAQFNQKLKLNVNMYCDMTTKKFVEKKCIYSFLIFTQKGEKSAGSVTYDLADFFNKRLYEVEQSFVLQKCPVKDTKVDMKIHYDESVEGGFDSMSQISVTSEMDTSSANPLDLSQLNQSKDLGSQKSSSTVEASRITEPVQTKKPQKQQDYSNLNESDVQSEQFKSRKIITQKYRTDSGKDNKIGENIKGIQQVTHKLNDFAVKFKQNLSYDVQQKKRKISKLTEELQSAQETNKKLESQLSQQKSAKDQLVLELSSFKSSLSSNESQTAQKVQQLQRKLEQQRKNNEKLQKRILDASEKGQQEGKYIEQLKLEFKKQQDYLKEKNQKLSEELKSQKSKKSELETKLNATEDNYNDLNEKYDRLLNKYESLESDIRKREDQLEEARINLDRAVQSLVDSLSSII